MRRWTSVAVMPVGRQIRRWSSVASRRQTFLVALFCEGADTDARGGPESLS